MSGNDVSRMRLPQKDRRTTEFNTSEACIDPVWDWDGNNLEVVIRHLEVGTFDLCYRSQ